MNKQFLVLWILGIFSSAVVIPYAFELQHEAVAIAPVSPLMLAVTAVIQTSLLLAIAIGVGLFCCRKIGFAPLALADARGNRKKTLKNIFLIAVPAGALTGVVIKLGDLLFASALPVFVDTAKAMPVTKSLLAAFYGGIAEELLLRLFVVTLLLWLIGRATGQSAPAKHTMIAGTAIALAAVLFGLGHLPATASLTELTPMVITRAIVLNGIGGLVFGWLYLSRGLEAAIIAHFTADVVLLSLLPALLP